MNLTDLHLLVRCVVAYRHPHGDIPLVKGEQAAAVRLVQAMFMGTADVLKHMQRMRPTLDGDALVHELAMAVTTVAKRPMNLNDLYLLVRVCKVNDSIQIGVYPDKGEKAAAGRLVKAGLLDWIGGRRISVYPTDDGMALALEFVEQMETRPIELALERG